MPNSLPTGASKGDFALDKVIAILILAAGAITSIISVGLWHYYQIALPVTVATASLLYLLLRGKLSRDVSFPKFQRIDRIRTVSHIIFAVSLSISIWLLWSNLYYRPPLYFTLVLVAVASIILEIFSLDEERNSQTYTVLFEIIILSLSVYGGIYWEFPGIFGADVWWHNEWIQETVSLGHITTGEFLANGYYLFPVFHLTAAVTSILTGLSAHSSVFASVGTLMAASCIFVFLIGKKLASTRIGLLAALIVPLTDWGILFGTSIVPNTLGFCLFAAILYLLFYRERITTSNTLLIILLSIALILTHTISAFIMLIALIAIFIAIKVYKQVDKPPPSYKHELVSLGFVVLFSIAMITRWMQAPPGSAAFFDCTLTSLVNSLQMDTQFVLTAPAAQADISYGALLLNQGGYLLLLLCGVVGTLIYLHPKNRTGSRIALILTAAILIATPYIFVLFHLRNVVPERWFIFFYVPLAILAAQGLLSISNILKGGIGKLAMVALVVLAIVAMMVVNNPANRDSPLLCNGVVRTGYTQSELTAIQTLSDMKCGRPETDDQYGNILPYVIGYDEYMDMVQRGNEVFIVRNYYLHHPEWNNRFRARIHLGGSHCNFTLQKVVIFDYMETQGLDNQVLIYSNPNVKVYTMPSSE